MEWLKKIREMRDLTQKEVANSVGITQTSYSNIENSKRVPSPKTAKKIADVLGFDWTRFFEEGQDGGQAFFEHKRA